MTRIDTAFHGRAKVSLIGLLRDIWPTRPSRPSVELRELPDHLKRDLGILDGSRPVGSVRW